jgi:hypothetical protein
MQEVHEIVLFSEMVSEKKRLRQIPRMQLLEIKCSKSIARKLNCSIVTFLEIQVPRTAISRKCFARIYMVENV